MFTDSITENQSWDGIYKVKRQNHCWFSKKISLNIQIKNFIYHSDSETIILAFFLSRRLSYTVISSYSEKLSISTNIKYTSSTRTGLTLQISVNHWQHLWCVGHSILNVAMIRATLSSMGMCIAQIQCVGVIFWCTKRLSNSWQKRLLLSSFRVYASYQRNQMSSSLPKWIQKVLFERRRKLSSTWRR